VELIPCACVLIPLILLGAWLAYAPLFKRQPEQPKAPPEEPK